jgi:hypothetical protein
MEGVYRDQEHAELRYHAADVGRLLILFHLDIRSADDLFTAHVCAYLAKCLKRKEINPTSVKGIDV